MSGKVRFDHDRIAALYERGFTSREVARHVGCNVTTVIRIARRRGLSRSVGPRRRTH